MVDRLADRKYTVSNCLFSGNTALSGVGGLSADGDVDLIDCAFYGNYSEYDCGGVCKSGKGDVINCVISGNFAETCAGGILLFTSAANPSKLTNCTIVGNTCKQLCGGLYCEGAAPIVTNCVIWGNVASEDPQISGAPSVTYSCVEGGYAGAGNIDVDPLFVDADGPDDRPGTPDDNPRLRPDSPCANTGLDEAPGLPATDLDGHARVLCGMVDMGAYESGFGDYECDGEIGLEDFAAWDACMTGPNGGPYEDGCESFDQEFDGDIDLRDFAAFQQWFATAREARGRRV
jgi:hypothetical protein